MLGSEREQQFVQAERLVELQSAKLQKELRLRDLVAIQILGIVGLAWVGTAAQLGSSHVMFWLGAVLLFYVPSGIWRRIWRPRCHSKAACINGPNCDSADWPAS